MEVHAGVEVILAIMLHRVGCAWLVLLTSRIQDLELKGNVASRQGDHAPRHEQVSYIISYKSMAYSSGLTPRYVASIRDQCGLRSAP